MKINKIYAYDLRNDAHFQFYTEFRNLVQKEEAVKQKIAPQFEAWLPLYDKEDTALIAKYALLTKPRGGKGGKQSAPQNETTEAQ